MVSWMIRRDPFCLFPCALSWHSYPLCSPPLTRFSVPGKVPALYWASGYSSHQAPLKQHLLQKDFPDSMEL